MKRVQIGLHPNAPRFKLFFLHHKQENVNIVNFKIIYDHRILT